MVHKRSGQFSGLDFLLIRGGVRISGVYPLLRQMRKGPYFVRYVVSIDHLLCLCILTPEKVHRSEFTPEENHGFFSFLSPLESTTPRGSGA